MEDKLKKIMASEEEEAFTIEFEGESYEFAKKELTWRQMNELLSRFLEVSKEGVKVHLEQFFEEAAIMTLTKAPWAQSDMKFVLRKLGPKFGAKLRLHLPGFESLLDGGDFFVGE